MSDFRSLLVSLIGIVATPFFCISAVAAQESSGTRASQVQVSVVAFWSVVDPSSKVVPLRVIIKNNETVDVGYSIHGESVGATLTQCAQLRCSTEGSSQITDGVVSPRTWTMVSLEYFRDDLNGGANKHITVEMDPDLYNGDPMDIFVTKKEILLGFYEMDLEWLNERTEDSSSIRQHRSERSFTEISLLAPSGRFVEQEGKVEIDLVCRNSDGGEVFSEDFTLERIGGSNALPLYSAIIEGVGPRMTVCESKMIPSSRIYMSESAVIGPY